MRSYNIRVRTAPVRNRSRDKNWKLFNTGFCLYRYGWKQVRKQYNNIYICVCVLYRYTKIKIKKPHTWTRARIRTGTRLFHTRYRYARVYSGEGGEPVGIWCVMMLYVGSTATILVYSSNTHSRRPKTRTLMARCNNISLYRYTFCRKTLYIIPLIYIFT